MLEYFLHFLQYQLSIIFSSIILIDSLATKLGFISSIYLLYCFISSKEILQYLHLLILYILEYVISFLLGNFFLYESLFLFIFLASLKILLWFDSWLQDSLRFSSHELFFDFLWKIILLYSSIVYLSFSIICFNFDISFSSSRFFCFSFLYNSSNLYALFFEYYI